MENRGQSGLLLFTQQKGPFPGVEGKRQICSLVQKIGIFSPKYFIYVLLLQLPDPGRMVILESLAD